MGEHNNQSKFEKAKDKIINLNRKSILSTSTLILAIVLIVVMTLFQTGLDPSKWRTTQFLTTCIITTAICILGVICGHGQADNHYRNHQKGIYIKTLNNYYLSRERINDNIEYFRGWSKQLYEQENYEKQFRYLHVEFGIEQANLVMKLTKEQVKSLFKPQKFIIDDKERFFDSLSQEQIEAVLAVLEGKVNVEYVHDDYFLNAFNSNKNKSMYEQASKQEQIKRNKFTAMLAYRIVLSLVIGLIFGALIVEQQGGEGGSQASQTVVNLVSRLFTLVSAVMWGFFIANDLIKLECQFLNYKIRKLDEFYLEVVEKKTKIIETTEERIKKEFENQEQKIELLPNAIEEFNEVDNGRDTTNTTSTTN